MYIKRVEIMNFRGFEGTKEFTFDNRSFVLLSAPNGLGKTTVIDAIEWCLTGSIGRLKNSFDSRSTNEDERKVNVKGILKNKNVPEDAIVKVTVEIIDGTESHTITRSQVKDELDSKKDVSLEVDGKRKGAEAWLKKYVDNSFYNYHFCDIQKSIGLQNEKRDNIPERFHEFITDYSKGDRVAENLKIFKLDADRRISDLNDQIEMEIVKKDSVKENLDKVKASTLSIVYPDIRIYQGEETSLEGQQKTALEEKKKTLFTCGYAHVAVVLQDIVAHLNAKEQIETLRQMKGIVAEKKTQIDDAIKNGLDKDNQCITKVSNAIAENKKLKLTSENVLQYGPTIVGFQSDAFTENYLEEQKKVLQVKKSEVAEKEEIIRNLTQGNMIIQQLSGMINQKAEFVAFRNQQMEERGLVRCPVCGSVEFGTISEDQILKEADTFVEQNNSLVKKETAAKKVLEDEQTKIFDEILQKAKEALEKKIKTDSDKLGRLIDLEKETKEFFQILEKEILLFQTGKTADWNSIPLLNQKIQEVQKSLLEDSVLKAKRDEIAAFMEVLGYQQENTENEKTLLPKIRALAAGAPEIMEFSVEIFINKINAISGMIQNEELLTYSKQFDEAEKKVNELIKQRNAAEHAKELADIQEKEIRETVHELREEEYRMVGPSLYKFYKKLSRIDTMKEIRIAQEGGDQKLSLTDESGKHVVNILSNGQLSVFMLSYFFAGILSRQKKEAFRVYFIDDLTSCMDDVNMLAFLDLMKYQLLEEDGGIDQIFFATCDERICKLLRYKMEGCGLGLCDRSEEYFV